MNIVNFLPIRTVKFLSSLQWRLPWFRRIYRKIAGAYTGRDATIARGPAKGTRFNSAGATNAGFILGTYEPEVQALYASLLKPGMVVYDVGAHVGFLAMLAAKLVGPRGRVICFEPLPSNIAAIHHNAELNRYANVTVLEVALGNEEGTAEFAISADPGWGRLSAAGPGPAETTGSVNVPVDRLDHVVGAREVPLPNIIKIDIEGGEISMLVGSQKTICEAQPTLLIELHGTNQQVDGILRDYGYESHVVGRTSSITEAPWDAFIIAEPAKYAERCEIAERLAVGAKLTR